MWLRDFWYNHICEPFTALIIACFLFFLFFIITKGYPVSNSSHFLLPASGNHESTFHFIALPVLGIPHKLGFAMYAWFVLLWMVSSSYDPIEFWIYLTEHLLCFFASNRNQDFLILGKHSTNELHPLPNTHLVGYSNLTIRQPPIGLLGIIASDISNWKSVTWWALEKYFLDKLFLLLSGWLYAHLCA